jgi:glutamate-1-semialdehyde 2,1-aminomutase
VPRNLQGTVFPFAYNDYDELETLVNAQDIGVIKMEVMRNMGPENDFLHKVRKLASDKGIVLIFDECTSGFRQTFGGLHKLYGVEPDMAMFGKALGNGYAITATIGRREIMEAAQSTFISSTFWTERIGPAAGLKTLEVMERMKSWTVITEMGLYIRQGFQRLADQHGLKIKHWGLPALTGYTFDSPQALAYKTFITQEMLAKGYLVGNSVYVCTEHTPAVVDRFLAELDPVFARVRDFEAGESVADALHGPVCHASFARLN